MTLVPDARLGRPAIRATVLRTSPLPRAVSTAIAGLDPGARAVDFERRRRVDRALRGALARHQDRHGDGLASAVAAVRVACAQLAAGDVEDAYLALLTARDLLR